jgi:hypothetical protein
MECSDCRKTTSVRRKQSRSTGADLAEGGGKSEFAERGAEGGEVEMRKSWQSSAMVTILRAAVFEKAPKPSAESERGKSTDRTVARKNAELSIVFRPFGSASS